MEGSDGIKTWQQQAAKATEKKQTKEKTTAQKKKKEKYRVKQREMQKRNKKLATEGQTSKILRYISTFRNMIIICP